MTRQNDRNQRPPEQQIGPLAGMAPPNDLDAEAAVLSASLMHREAFDEAAEVLSAVHFYADANRHIWTAMLALVERGAPVDLVTVASELKNTGKLDQIGGTPYLHQIANATPHVANVVEHAKIVVDKHRLRLDIALSRRFLAEAYAATDAQAHIDSHEHALFELSRQGRSSEVEHIRTIAKQAIDNARNAKAADGVTGVATGIHELDKMTTGLHPGDLIIIAGRPGQGKTSLALNWAVNIASPNKRQLKLGESVVPGKGVLFISLEMPKDQLAARVLAMESGVGVSQLRSGKISPDNWNELAATSGWLSNLPLWLDDTPGLNITQFRAKLRKAIREAQRGTGTTPPSEFGAAFIDYMQLMRALDPKQPREQQVSEISRTLKEIAKECGIPVIALSQLNRSVETRGGDKRPMLSDLRECLPVDEWIYTEHGPVRLGSEPRSVSSLAPCGMVDRPASYVQKKYNRVFEVSTQFGTFRATARHLVLTGVGWKQVRDLDPARDVIAAPKFIPNAARGHKPHARLLGWLLGNGGLSGTPALIYRKELDADVRREVALFGVDVRPRKNQKSEGVFDTYLSNGTETGSLPNTLMLWLRKLGLEGKTAHTKTIPAEYLGTCQETHTQLLRGMWEADGTVTDGGAKYTTVSEIMARQVAWLLLTIGVRSTVNCYQGLWEVHACMADNERMRPVVCAPGRFGALRDPDPDYVDPAPALFVEMAAELGSGRRFQKRPDGAYKMVCKAEMAEVVRRTPALSTIASSPYMTAQDVGWGRLYSVTPSDTEVRVADLQVPGTNNFVAGGIVVHNSGAIEQDADTIMFVYRDEYYNKDSEWKGTAEIILAKQRNGPTGMVRTAFAKHTTRFDNLADDYDNGGYAEEQ